MSVVSKVWAAAALTSCDKKNNKERPQETHVYVLSNYIRDRLKLRLICEPH